ncbi:glycosyltransferase [Burkholderiales bacterium]|nr:glycosyltransferase [Burkholderiales bacterium]
MVDIAFLTASDLRNTTANSMQVMKMAQSLLTHDPNLLMTAIGDETNRPNCSELQKRYGVTKLPDTLSFWRARGRLGIHSYNLNAALAARKVSANLVLTRSIGAAVITARLNLPTIYECHAPPSGLERYFFMNLMRSKNFKRLVVVSSALSEILKNRYPNLKHNQIVVAHDGVDLSQFKSLPSVEEAKMMGGRSLARPIAGYAGHLYSGRGIELILDCAESLPHWDFLIVGGTHDAVAHLRSAIQARDVHNIELLGFVNNIELPSRMAVCDVLLMPYQDKVYVSGGKLDTASWMSPLKMFEYLAMERAIISSDLPVLREVICDRSAILVAPQDSQQWIDALRALEARQVRMKLAHQAKNLSKNYDWDSRVSKILHGIY